MSDPPSNSGRMASREKKSNNSDRKKSASWKKQEKGRSRIAAQLCPPRDRNPGPPARPKKMDNRGGGRAVAGNTIHEDENETPKSVMDFFARAGFAPVNPQAGLAPGISLNYADMFQGATVNPTVQQIFSNPCHSLELVEKQQLTASSEPTAVLQKPKADNDQRPKTTKTQKPKAANNQRPKAAYTQKPKAANTQRPKAAYTQKPKTTGAQKSNEDGSQKPKEDGTQKPKEGEGKSSNPDAPCSLEEFLSKLKFPKSDHPGPEGTIEEIPDLLSMIPEPPIQNIASIPGPFQPMPFPGLFRPIETYDFIPAPVDLFGFMSGSSRPLLPYPRPDLGLFHQQPPKPSEIIPGAAAQVTSTPKPLSVPLQEQEPPVSSKKSQPPSVSFKKSQRPPVSSKKSQLSPVSSQKSQLTPALSQKSQPTPVSSKKSQRPPISSQKSQPPPVSYKKSEPLPVSSQKSKPSPVSSQTVQPSLVSSQTSQAPPVSYQKSEPLPVSSQSAQPPPVSSQKSQAPPVSCQKSEPLPVSCQKSEPPPASSQKSQPPPPLSPTTDRPAPLSSILKSTRRSVQPKPTLTKPASTLPEHTEPSSSSVPAPMVAPENSKTNAKHDDCKGQTDASVAGNKADENGAGSGIGAGNNNSNDKTEEGATAAPNPPPQSQDLKVEALTRDQLFQAIVHLLKNDPNFIKNIHEAYLNSLNEKLA